MTSPMIRFFAIAILAASAVISASAQRRSGNATVSGSTNPPVSETTQKDDDVPKNIQETLAKHRIERSKKEFAELVERSEEAVKISEDLEKSLTATARLTAVDQKKLERLEKLLKKIRSELGAEGDDDDAAEKPSTLNSAVASLQSNASRLLEEVKKSTRYSISVVSVQTSNLLLRLVKFIRFNR